MLHFKLHANKKHNFKEDKDAKWKPQNLPQEIQLCWFSFMLWKNKQNILIKLKEN